MRPQPRHEPVAPAGPLFGNGSLAGTQHPQPYRKRVIPRHGVRLDRTPGDDAVYVEAARANLRARRARGFLERRVTRLSLPALRPRPRPTVPSPSVEWLKKYPLPSIALQAYWRIAGMSYLKYSNMCAEVVRASLKEPFFTKVRPQSLSPSRRPTRRGTRVSDFLACPDPTRRRRR